MKKNKGLLPNIITFGNLLLGFGAIVLITRGQYTPACWLIFAASIFDGLDGLVSRLLHSSSKFGVELDSLTDVVSFGIAPALLMYKAVFESFGIAGFIFSFTYILIGVMRLAKFNIMGHSPEYKGRFSGMPITSAALIVISAFLYFDSIPGKISLASVYFPLIPILTFFMLSKIYFRKLPVVPVRNCNYPIFSIIFLVICGGLIIWKPALVLFPFMMIYLLTGPVGWIYNLVRTRGNTEYLPQDDDDDDYLEAEDDFSDQRSRL